MLLKMKTGISPLIATILIIGFTVVLATFILTWGFNFFEGLQKSSEKTYYESIMCSSEVVISLRSSCLNGDEVIALVENSGSKNFENILIRFYGTLGGDTSQINQSLKPWEIKKFSSFFDASKVGVLEKIEVYPLVNLEGKTVFCSNNYDKSENIKNCITFCENATPGLCGGIDLVFGLGYKETVCCEEFKICC